MNDSMGHKAGDDLLVAAAQRLNEAVREHDTVARLGGDEFAVVQTAIASAEDAAVLARRLVSKFQQPFTLAGGERRITLSIGVAIAPIHGTTVDEVLNRADAALYSSKRAGKNRFTIVSGIAGL